MIKAIEIKKSLIGHFFTMTGFNLFRQIVRYNYTYIYKYSVYAYVTC